MEKGSIFRRKSVLVIVALLCCFLWGSAFPGMKLSYIELNITGEFQKILLAGIRFLLAGFGVLIFAKAKQKVKLMPTRSELWIILVVALCQTVLTHIASYIGIGHTTGVKGSIIASLSVFFVAIYAHFMFKTDKLSLKKIFGMVCGFSGVVLVNLTFITATSFTFSFIGEGLIMLHAAFTALGTVLVRKYSGKMNIVKLNGWQLFIGGLVLVATGYAGGSEPLVFNTAALLLLIYMAALSGVAFTLWFILLQYHKASLAEQFKFSLPLFGSCLSVLFIPGEYMGIEMLAAACLVAAGIIIVNRADRRMIKDEQSHETS